MKIEKINDRQIRCTLYKKDLAERELKISELAYGSEKAKALFREMMQQASYEVGFEAEDIPLMIEAIPMPGEGLVLIVTKVDDPEELDTRFSKFTKSVDVELSEDDDSTTQVDNVINTPHAEEILNCFEKLTDMISKAKQTAKEAVVTDAAKVETNRVIAPEEPEDQPANKICKIYLFNSLDTVIKTTAIVNPYYDGESSLYKSPDMDRYFLVLKPSEKKLESFNRVCGIMSEYGSLSKSTYATMDFMNEHLTLVISDKAISTLSKL